MIAAHGTASAIAGAQWVAGVHVHGLLLDGQDLVAFERNGYDVTYLSGVDVDRKGQLLKNHKLFISIGHDEYWSEGQRKNVEAARAVLRAEARGRPAELAKPDVPG